MRGLNKYLVSYDIMDQKRLHRVHRTMKGFGYPLHYSVFQCDLSPQGRVELVAALSELIDHKKDRIMIVDLGPSEGSAEKRIEFLGVHPPARDRQALIF